MGLTKFTNIVYERIQLLEPENVSNKIICYLISQDYTNHQMNCFAFASEDTFSSLIKMAKTELGLSSSALYTGSSPPIVSVSPTVPIGNRFRDSYSRVMDFEIVQNQLQSLNMKSELLEPSYNHHLFYQNVPLPVRTNQRPSNVPGFPVKACRYFNQGYCKHGNSCRYFHGLILPERKNFSQRYNYNPNSNDEYHIVLPGSLRKLESEIVELLKSRRGVPVSIALLRSLYHEKYGKPLQAEGYVTERQRHGKHGYGLTKLLTRFKKSICVIVRPHGQHDVILRENLPKFEKYYGERKEQGEIVAGSIYLTLPPERIFNEQDLYDYFSKFGQVKSVKIPWQLKRMYCFVTFFNAESIKQILSNSKETLHLVCGVRVLVKPYRKRSYNIDRKFTDKVQHNAHYGYPFIGRDTEMNPIPPRAYKQSPQEHEQFNPKRKPFYRYVRHPIDDLKLPDDQWRPCDYLLDVQYNKSTADNRILHINTNYKDTDSQGLNFPESPFGDISTFA